MERRLHPRVPTSRPYVKCAIAAYGTITEPRLPASNVSPSELVSIVPSSGDKPVSHFRSRTASFIKPALVLATHTALSPPTASATSDQQTSDSTMSSTVCETGTRLAMMSLRLDVALA